MNHHTHTIGDGTSVASRFGSESAAVRPEKLMDVLCFNKTGGLLYMQVHEVATYAVPAEGAVPKAYFPVQSMLGGALGRPMDLQGIYCCWSSTPDTKTLAAASGEILIVIKA